MKTVILPVIASILILGTLGLTDAFAGNHGNNGNNGCEKSNPNSRACEKNPNTTPNTPPTIGSVTLTQDAFGDVSGSFGAASRPTVCDANDVMDADGDLVTLSFEWLREDGTLITTGSTLPIASVVNELVTCKVTPFDGTDFGASASSSVLLITLGA